MFTTPTVLSQRVERVGGVVARAEQALLLGRDRQHQDRPLRRRRHRRERATEFDHAADARRVVHGAVIHLVAVHRHADAEVIPVRRVDRRTRPSATGSLPSIFPTTLCESIVRMVLRSVTEALAPSGIGLNDAGHRLLLGASKSLPGEREQLPRLLQRDPALDGRAAHVPVGRNQAELLRGLALHDRERVARPARSRAR